MKIYVISLASSVRRRSAAQAALDALGLDYEFVDAIDGRAGLHPLLQRYDPRRFLRNHGRPAMPGEIGCYASHYLAWQKCVAAREPALILEDDFALEERFLEAKKLCERLILRVPFVRMERCSPKPAYSVWRQGEYRLVKFLKVPQCLTCYAVSVGAAQAFINASQRFVYPVDVFVRNQYLHKVPIYGLLPHAARSGGAESTIGDRHAARVGARFKLSRAAHRLHNALRNLLLNLRHLMLPPPAPDEGPSGSFAANTVPMLRLPAVLLRDQVDKQSCEETEEGQRRAPMHDRFGQAKHEVTGHQ